MAFDSLNLIINNLDYSIAQLTSKSRALHQEAAEIWEQAHIPKDAEAPIRAMCEAYSTQAVASALYEVKQALFSLKQEVSTQNKYDPDEF